jgi:hypothetical protein
MRTAIGFPNGARLKRWIVLLVTLSTFALSAASLVTYLVEPPAAQAGDCEYGQDVGYWCAMYFECLSPWWESCAVNACNGASDWFTCFVGARQYCGAQISCTDPGVCGYPQCP